MEALLRYAKFYNLGFCLVAHPRQPRFIITLFKANGSTVAMGEGTDVKKATVEVVARAGDEYPALDWA